MKIRILKDILVEVEKIRLQETWDKQLRRWDELNVESIHPSLQPNYSDFTTQEGDTIVYVPDEAFEVLGS